MTLNKYLRYTALFVIFLIPFICLTTSSNLFFPFITGKNFLFRILVEIATGLWLILAIRDKSYLPKISWILKSFLFLLVTMAISDLMSPNVLKSFMSNFERMDGYVTLAHLFLFFIVTSSVIDTQKLWTRFFQTSLVASLIAGGYGVLQLAGKLPINQGGVRLDATFGNATYFSVYMMFHVFFAFMLLMRERLNRWMQAVYGVVILFELFMIYHTATRGVFLGMVAGAILITALVALMEKERVVLRKGAMYSFGVVLLLVAGFFSIKNTDFVKTNEVLGRFSSINYNEAKPRLYVWNMAWQGVKEKPIFGWGQESFNYVFNKYYDPKMYTQEQWFDRTHDIIFDWLIAGGFLGLIGYLSLFISLLYYVWHGTQTHKIHNNFLRKILEKLKLSGDHENDFSLTDRAIITGLLGAYFFHNIFVFDNITSYILFITVLAYVHHMKGTEISEKYQNELTFDKSIQNSLLVPAVIIVTFGSLYLVNYSGYMQAKTLIDTLRPQPGGPAENLKTFEKALSYNTFGNAEIREQIVQAALNSLGSSADNKIKQDYFNLAKKEIENQVRITPEDARYQLFAGSFLSRFRLYDDAQKYLDEAVRLSPHKQTILYEVGSNYMNRGKYAEASDAFKKAYELEPKNTTARDYYAVSLIYAGKQAEADKFLIEGYGSVLVMSDIVIKAYVDTKQYNKVIPIWKARIAEDPKNYQFHVSLAAAYVEAGDSPSAIKELQKAIEINPEFKEQGTYYIKEIQAGRHP